jgi:hypothetical protein
MGIHALLQLNFFSILASFEKLLKSLLFEQRPRKFWEHFACSIWILFYISEALLAHNSGYIVASKKISTASRKWLLFHIFYWTRPHANLVNLIVIISNNLKKFNCCCLFIFICFCIHLAVACFFLVLSKVTVVCFWKIKRVITGHKQNY